MDKLTIKILKLAAQICWMHGEIAGNQVCQDWSGETNILDTLTDEEKNKLIFDYEQFNSGGADYRPGRFVYDEMIISFTIARALEIITEQEELS